MAEMTPAQEALAPSLATQAGFADFKQASEVLSFKRGGAPVDDLQTFTALMNHSRREGRHQESITVSERLTTTQQRIQRQQLEDVTGPQRALLSDMLNAIEQATLPENDPDLVEDVEAWGNEVRRARRRGSNMHQASQFISRGYAIIEDLGIEFARASETTEVSEDEESIATGLSDGTTASTDDKDNEDEF